MGLILMNQVYRPVSSLFQSPPGFRFGKAGASFLYSIVVRSLDVFHFAPKLIWDFPVISIFSGQNPPSLGGSSSEDSGELRSNQRERFQLGFSINQRGNRWKNVADFGRLRFHTFRFSPELDIVIMSMASESPVNSSSSDDFAALLDAELEAASSNASLDYEEEDVDDNDNDNDDDDDDDDDDDEDEDEDDSARSKRQKRVDKLEDNIEKLQESTSLPEMQQKLDASIKEEVCTHPAFIREMCIICGQHMDDDGAAVAFGYIHKDLKIGTEEAARLRGEDLKNLLRNKKLYLVLDLDHTLLNSTLFKDISPEEEDLNSQIKTLQNSSRDLFKLDSIRMVTKLRPFVQTFLKEASSMFEMYIYTMAERAYALEMARLLDPDGVYFHSRVISQADCTQKHQKGLDVVLGADNAVLILDDTEMVWQKHIENLIVMDRYYFFPGSGRPFNFRGKSLSETKMDESDTNGALATVLRVLKEVHRRFFYPEDVSNVESRDVRQFLKAVRKEVLKGCKLVFTHVWRQGERVQDQKLWLMAEQLGATCVQELDESVTHVVSMDPGTEKSRWAVKKNKFLVHPRWIEAANFLWRRHPEEDFKVQKTPL